MLGNDEEAKDVLQEAFVQVFLKIKDLKDLSSFPAWIKRIVVNKCLGALRGRKNFVDIDNVPSHESTGDPFEQQSGIGWSPQGYKTQEVMKAIDQISEGCRTVLNLYLFEGYDHQEIAQILGCSVSTSKAQYSRARSKVRKIIGQTLEP
jgi:RNA polymerase sigma-70 factor (ECF subfamily)